MEVKAVLRQDIRVNVEDLPPGSALMLMEALSIPNIAKEQAKKQHQWGWGDMPDYIDLWAMDGDDFVMPRGFKENFVQGLKLLGHRVEWSDQRVYHQKFRIGDEPNLKPWQVPAMNCIVAECDGMYKAPAGSGKTVAVLATIQKLGCQSLIIVNTKDILWQWQERTVQFLGESYPIGQVGDNEFDVSPYITIATAQTLHRRYEELNSSGFFDKFSFVCLDECHHATAETYNRIMGRFSARYRIGVSATPDKTGDFALAINVLGPVIHVTRHKDVDTLQRPEVRRIPTDFAFRFKGTRSQWQRSNYGELLTKLVNDPDRNELIIRQILEEQGHHQLVISKRLAHLDILESMLYDAGCQDAIIKITGKETSEDRQQAKSWIEDFPCILLSTLADEAMDIPRLDRIHLTFPQRNAGLVTQQVGRVERKHPDKDNAIIYDYADTKVGPLTKQWRIRRFEVYEPRGYKIDLNYSSV